MRLPCPLCGERDHREFTYKSVALDRPTDEGWSDAWNDFIHLRDNPAGPQEELWWHGAGCGAWLVVTRDTRDHSVLNSRLAGERGRES